MKTREERRQYAIELYRSGMSAWQIAQKMDLSEITIRKYIAGVARPNTDLVGKGLAKGAVIAPVKPHVERSDRRPVHIGDNKNTIIWVDRTISDKKAIQRYYERQEKLKTIK